MTPATRCSIVISLVISMALPAWGQQYYLYAPQPSTSGQKSPDGILVQDVEIQKGDTLYGLSRKFSGHGMYFPQILLFNAIKNPRLIYPGSTLKIPVTQKEVSDAAHPDAKPKSSSRDAAPSVKAAIPAAAQQSAATAPASTSNTELSLSDLKKVGAGKTATRHNRKTAMVRTHKNKKIPAPAAASPLPAAHAAVAPVSNGATGQKLFEAAVKAYRQDDCRSALELLDRYLTDNPGSPLAADATLYKAECYLKLSAQ